MTRTPLNKIITLKKELPELKTIEPFQCDVINCETKEDFIEQLHSKLDEYNNMTTQKLNKIFRIPGYRVTKIKGEIGLRKDSATEREDQKTERLPDAEALRAEIEMIKDAFNQLSDQVETLKEIVLSLGKS